MAEHFAQANLAKCSTFYLSKLRVVEFLVFYIWFLRNTNCSVVHLCANMNVCSIEFWYELCSTFCETFLNSLLHISHSLCTLLSSTNWNGKKKWTRFAAGLRKNLQWMQFFSESASKMLKIRATFFTLHLLSASNFLSHYDSTFCSARTCSDDGNMRSIRQRILILNQFKSNSVNHTWNFSHRSKIYRPAAKIRSLFDHLRWIQCLGHKTIEVKVNWITRLITLRAVDHLATLAVIELTHTLRAWNTLGQLVARWLMCSNANFGHTRGHRTYVSFDEKKMIPKKERPKRSESEFFASISFSLRVYCFAQENVFNVFFIVSRAKWTVSVAKVMMFLRLLAHGIVWRAGHLRLGLMCGIKNSQTLLIWIEMSFLARRRWCEIAEVHIYVIFTSCFANARNLLTMDWINKLAFVCCL